MLCQANDGLWYLNPGWGCEDIYVRVNEDGIEGTTVALKNFKEKLRKFLKERGFHYRKLEVLDARSIRVVPTAPVPIPDYHEAVIKEPGPGFDLIWFYLVVNAKEVVDTWDLGHPLLRKALPNYRDVKGKSLCTLKKLKGDVIYYNRLVETRLCAPTTSGCRVVTL